MKALVLAVIFSVVGLLAAFSIASADGGPHGGFTPTTDGCAGCHRSHTGQAAKLLKTDQSTLCFSCHDGTGSNLDAWDGAQLGTNLTAGRASGGAPTGISGALRGGGFVYARINTSGGGGKIGDALANTAAGVKVTSAHVKFSDNGLTPSNTVWGQGAATNGSGTVLNTPLSCGDCHNPHGSGTYRILRPLPNGASGTSVTLADETTKNYATGQYWDTYKGIAVGSSATVINATDLSKWCATCHTRYQAGGGFVNASSGDAIYAFRHPSDGSLSMPAGSGSPFVGATYDAFCLQCHVAHGSNASMAGDGKTTFSSQQAWPGGATGRGNESTLLKVDNRGTCVTCHGSAP